MELLTLEELSKKNENKQKREEKTKGENSKA
jgi:hypothetical protein